VLLHLKLSFFLLLGRVVVAEWHFLCSFCKSVYFSGNGAICVLHTALRVKLLSSNCLYDLVSCVSFVFFGFV
jgi:hypothetical protein